MIEEQSSVVEKVFIRCFLAENPKPKRGKMKIKNYLQPIWEAILMVISLRDKLKITSYFDGG
jgi:hypothetical protein